MSISSHQKPRKEKLCVDHHQSSERSESEWKCGAREKCPMCVSFVKVNGAFDLVFFLLSIDFSHVWALAAANAFRVLKFTSLVRDDNSFAATTSSVEWNCCIETAPVSVPSSVGGMAKATHKTVEHYCCAAKWVRQLGRGGKSFLNMRALCARRAP